MQPNQNTLLLYNRDGFIKPSKRDANPGTTFHQIFAESEEVAIPLDTPGSIRISVASQLTTCSSPQVASRLREGRWPGRGGEHQVASIFGEVGTIFREVRGMVKLLIDVSVNIDLWRMFGLSRLYIMYSACLNKYDYASYFAGLHVPDEQRTDGSRSGVQSTAAKPRLLLHHTR